MASRFYQETMPTGRPVFFENFGNLLKISGLVMQGEGKVLLLWTPTADPMEWDEIDVEQPTLEEWGMIIRETDDPKVLEWEPDGVNIKAIHRKVRYAISGAVQQKVWAQDGFRCQFCGNHMGDAQLTVDHWIPLELGGANDTTNYITACRKCNKLKGSLPPEVFCASHGYDYYRIDTYVKSRPKMR